MKIRKRISSTLKQPNTIARMQQTDTDISEDDVVITAKMKKKNKKIFCDLKTKQKNISF